MKPGQITTLFSVSKTKGWFSIFNGSNIIVFNERRNFVKEFHLPDSFDNKLDAHTTQANSGAAAVHSCCSCQLALDVLIAKHHRSPLRSYRFFSIPFSYRLCILTINHTSPRNVFQFFNSKVWHFTRRSFGVTKFNEKGAVCL